LIVLNLNSGSARALGMTKFIRIIATHSVTLGSAT
jgi:hypothetical protein